MDIYPKSKVHGLFQKWGWRAKKKEFIIRPITYGNMHRIASLVLSIDLKEEETQLRKAYRLMEQHTDTVAKVLAIAIVNSKAGPPKEMWKDLLFDLTTKECLNILLLVLKQIDVSGFYNTIVLISGLNVVEKVKQSDENTEAHP